MAKIKMTQGLLDADKLGIPKIGGCEKFNTNLNAGAKMNSIPPVASKTVTPSPKQELKLWDDYTANELVALRKNQREIYISLFYVKYGFAPPK